VEGLGETAAKEAPEDVLARPAVQQLEEEEEGEEEEEEEEKEEEEEECNPLGFARDALSV